MGLCSTKGIVSVGSKCISETKSTSHNIRRNSTDTDRLISTNSNYHSYIPNDYGKENNRHEFKVTQLNLKMRSIRKGYLNITKFDLIFSKYPHKKDIYYKWSLTTLRWYAYTNNFFIFQCGRKASTGEGTFIFSCDEYKRLKCSFESLVEENYSFHKANQYSRLPLINYPSNAISSNTRMSRDVQSRSPHEFTRSQSVNPSCYHSCLERNFKYLEFPITPVVTPIDTNSVFVAMERRALSSDTFIFTNNGTSCDSTVTSGTLIGGGCEGGSLDVLSSNDYSGSSGSSNNRLSINNSSSISQNRDRFAVSASNYLNGADAAAVAAATAAATTASTSANSTSNVASGPEYLVAAMWHGYVNENGGGGGVNGNDENHLSNARNNEFIRDYELANNREAAVNYLNIAN